MADGNYDSPWNDDLWGTFKRAVLGIGDQGFLQDSKHGSPGTSQNSTSTDGVQSLQEFAEEQASAEKLRGAEKYADEHGKDGLVKADLNKPIEFNPPLHPTLRMTGDHAIPDPKVQNWGAENEPRKQQKNFRKGDRRIKFEPDHSTGEARSASKWRLGQILPGDAELVDTGRSPVRYGFRFLYNPTSINFSTQVNESIHTDPSTINGQSVLFMKSGLGQVSMQLLLNRIPDVMLGSEAPTPQKLNDSSGPDRGGWSVSQRGTEFDLEYLFRTINGIWNLRDTTNINDDNDDGKFAGFQTGDAGMLLPTPVWVSVGPTMKYYGRVVSMSHEHFMFSRDMIPVLTRVNITFQRIFRGSPDDVDLISKAAAFSRRAKEDQFPDEGEDADGGGNSDGSGGSNISETNGIKIIKQPRGDSFKVYIWRTLLMNNYSPQQAAGIMGNLQQETGGTYDPGIRQQGGPGRGIAQWSEGGRWEGVKRLANKRDGYGPNTIEIQMEYMMKEMKEGTGCGYGFKDKDFRVITIVSMAAVYFHNRYECSADSSTHTRESNAVSIYKQLHEKRHLTGYSVTGSGSQVNGWPVDNQFKMTNPYGGFKNGTYTCHAHPAMQPGGHSGIDISGGGMYGKPVYALKDGTLKHVSNGMGTEVMVVSGTGYNWNYCHLSSREANGKKVKKGDTIGRVGYSGTSGPSMTHLHLECYKPGITRWNCGNFVDPMKVLTDPTTVNPGGGGSGGGSWSARISRYVVPSSSEKAVPIDLFDYIGDTPYRVSPDRKHLYQDIGGKHWVAPTPASVRMYPRNPLQAVRHGVESLISGVIPPEPWVGRPMAAVARCYGLPNGETDKIPREIVGPKTSPARQFRWVAKNHPDLAVVAPHTHSFGTDVPIGAILYWDEGTGGGYGSVGIAMGYRHGLLQQMTTAPGSAAMIITDVQPNRCLGWTVPLFFAEPSFIAYGLMDTVDIPVLSGRR